MHSLIRIILMAWLGLGWGWLSCSSDSGVEYEKNTEQTTSGTNTESSSTQESGHTEGTQESTVPQEPQITDGSVQDNQSIDGIPSENPDPEANTLESQEEQPAQDASSQDKESAEEPAGSESAEEPAGSESAEEPAGSESAGQESSTSSDSSDGSSVPEGSADSLGAEASQETLPPEMSQDAPDQVSACATGQTRCQGICVDTLLDPSHCGSCGSGCLSGQRCWGGQCQAGQQAQGWGGSMDDEGMGIAVDAQHNVYVTGRFQQTLAVGTNTFASKGSVDIFVAKFNAQGQVEWFRQAGGSDYDTGVEIALDRQGNVIIAGYFTGVVGFGTLSFTSTAGGDLFVAKLTPAGQWSWVKHAGGSQFDRAYGLTTDSKDNIYVCGQIMASATFGTITKATAGSSDLFVAKLDSAGQWLWVEAAGGTDADYAWKVTTDLQDQVYVVGRFGGTARFSTHTLTSRGSFDAYVAKLNPQGQWLWVEQAGGQGHDQADGVITDRQGNVYITGYFYSAMSGATLTIGTFGTFTLAPQGGFDFFVARLDPQGKWQWVNYATGTGKDYAHDIGLDASGNVYIVGDSDSSSMTFGSLTITTSGQRDIMTASLDSSGQWVWAQSSGGQGFDGSYDTAVSSDGTMYITGHFSQTATLFGSLTLSSSGGYDIFVASTYRGMCSVSCASGTTCCLGTCRDLQQDGLNCGLCGQVCPVGKTCTGGVCQ